MSVFHPQEKPQSNLARPAQKHCRDPRNLLVGAWPAERSAAKGARMANVSPHLDALDRLLPPPLGAALRPHARIVSRQPGHSMMGYGDRTSELYLILEGHLRAELHSPTGRDVSLADLGPGEL